MSDLKDLTPIHLSISVSWSQEEAFRRFTADFENWWPSASHSIGGPRVKKVVFEPRVGGRIYEEHLDGRRFQWGEVLDWDPPFRVRFTFHPSRDAATAQEVEVRFAEEDSGTLVTLTASGWEKWGSGAERARRGYRMGWAYILNLWAGKRTARMGAIRAIGKVALAFELIRYGGRSGIINSAAGEIARRS